MTNVDKWRARRKKQLDELVLHFERDFRPVRSARAGAITTIPPSTHLTQLQTAVANIRGSDWYKEFDGAKDTTLALRALEKEFRAYVTDVRSNWSLPSATQDGEREVHRQEPDECDLQAQLLENELWFRRLYAQVISIEEQGTAFPSLSDRIDGREKYQRSVKAFKQETLRLALRDRELLAALPHADRSFLEGLQDRLEALQTVLERTRNSIEEKGAKHRASNGARTPDDEEPRKTDGREVVRYLVEVCMKTYLFCDLAVIKKLIRHPLSSARHLRNPKLMELIERTGDRKLENAQRWMLDERDMLELSSRYTVPIGMVIHHWTGEPSP